MKYFILFFGALLIEIVTAALGISILKSVGNFFIVAGLDLVWVLLWNYIYYKRENKRQNSGN